MMGYHPFIPHSQLLENPLRLNLLNLTLTIRYPLHTLFIEHTHLGEVEEV
jgi:hypothetical protein